MCRRCFALEQLLASVSRKTFIYAWTITGQAARVAMARMSRYHRARRRGRDSFTSAGRVLHPLPPFFLVRAMPGDQHHLASSHLTILHYTIGSCSQRTRASCVTWGGGRKRLPHQPLPFAAVHWTCRLCYLSHPTLGIRAFPRAAIRCARSFEPVRHDTVVSRLLTRQPGPCTQLLLGTGSIAALVLRPRYLAGAYKCLHDSTIPSTILCPQDAY